MPFYSELGEDRWIWDNVDIAEEGTYLDLGSAHPIHNSQTAFLRDLGWTGVGVDANQAYVPNWAHLHNTGFECCVVSSKPTVRWSLNPENFGLSRVVDYASPGIEIPAMTATAILEKHGLTSLDFLSLDLEGHEYEALMSLDLAKYRPKIIVSEYNTQGCPMDYRVREFLSVNAYHLVHSTSSNDIFTADT